MILRLYVSLLPALILSACATINNTSVDYFRIDTVPQGAKVTTTLGTGCAATPCAIPAPRTSRFIATVDHDGFQTAEIFIDNSPRRGSFAGNMTSTAATMSAATVGISAFAAGMVNVFGFGTTIVPTSTVLASAASPMIAVTGGMLLIDASSGANRNLFPNPVVLGLAPEGTETNIDPLVAIYKSELDAESAATLACASKKLKTKSGKLACENARETYSANKNLRKATLKTLYEKSQTIMDSQKHTD